MASDQRLEHWLLESVVEYKLPFGILLSESLDEALNKPEHGDLTQGFVAAADWKG